MKLLPEISLLLFYLFVVAGGMNTGALNTASITNAVSVGGVEKITSKVNLLEKVEKSESKAGLNEKTKISITKSENSDKLKVDKIGTSEGKNVVKLKMGNQSEVTKLDTELVKAETISLSSSETSVNLKSRTAYSISAKDLQEQDEIINNTSQNMKSSSPDYFRKLFSFTSSVNKCIEANCQYCCLNINFCGSKTQCMYSKATLNIFKIFFYCLCIILFTFFVYKVWITDPENEHGEADKLDDKTLLNLIQTFIRNRDNRRKFRYSSETR